MMEHRAQAITAINQAAEKQGRPEAQYTRLLALLPPSSSLFAMSHSFTPPPLLPNLDPQALSDAQLEQEARARFTMCWEAMDIKESPIPAPIFSMDTLQHKLQDEPGPSQFPWVLPLVFTGTPISQPTPTPAMGTLAGGADIPPPEPCYFPPGKKLAKKGTLTEATELSMFDILNTFQCHWFLSVEHLRAQALSAQKANNRKIFWVEFTPQFHAHLVKCTVALVPWPISKVKKVMFCYILELLNKEGPQAFFDLTKGQRHESHAQKEKKQLARKRNCASWHEQCKAAKEAMKGLPQWKCEWCGQKFASHKNVKWHQCPNAKGAKRGEWSGKGRGKMVTNPQPSKPVSNIPPTPSSSTSTPHTTTSFGSKKKRPRVPSSAQEVALATIPLDTMDKVFHLSTPHYTEPSTRTSKRLNTSKKHRIWKGVMESVDAHNQSW
jgi:hypothetical protein